MHYINSTEWDVDWSCAGSDLVPGFSSSQSGRSVTWKRDQRATSQLNCINWKKPTLQPRQKILLTNAALLRFVMIVPIIGKSWLFMYFKGSCRSSRNIFWGYFLIWITNHSCFRRHIYFFYVCRKSDGPKASLSCVLRKCVLPRDSTRRSRLGCVFLNWTKCP